MSELSPARQELLKQSINAMERMLHGCSQVFQGLSHHPDAEVSSVSQVCLEAIDTHMEALGAMIDGLHETRH